MDAISEQHLKNVSADTAVEARRLVKLFDGQRVIDGVSFEIKSGQCFGFLGSNGAGKSTLMKLMYCTCPVSSGELFVSGLNVKSHQTEIRARVGILPQSGKFDSELTAFHHVYSFARLHGLTRKDASSRAMELLRFVDIEDLSERSMSELDVSGLRRIAFARTLVNNPKILFLDEPTTGLDRLSRQFLWGRLRELKQKGTTLVIATNSMDEAELLCDQIAFIEEGQLLCVGSPRKLISDYVGKQVVEFSCPIDDIDYYLGRVRDQYDYQVVQNRIRLFIKQDEDAFEALRRAGGTELTIRKASLQDVFLRLSGYDI